MERASRRLAARLAARSELAELTETWCRSLLSRPRVRTVSTTTPPRSSSVESSVQRVGTTPPSPIAILRDKFKQILSSRRATLPPGASNLQLPTIPSPTTIRTALAYHIASLYERYHKPVFSLATLSLAYATYSTTQSLLAKVIDTSTSASTMVSTVPSILGLAVVVTSLTAYLRHCTIRPDAVYRKAMMRLNAHPGVLEILGAPVVGSSTRASVVRGGGLVVEGGKLRMAPKQVDMVWELTGGYRGRGQGGRYPLHSVVSVEGVKEHGTLRLKVLALDVERNRGTDLGHDTRHGMHDNERGMGEERVYVLGGIREYEASNVLQELKAVVKSTTRAR